MNDNIEEIMTYEMPCQCACGNWFDLNEGNPCSSCNLVYCTDCLEEPFDICDSCQKENLPISVLDCPCNCPMLILEPWACGCELGIKLGGLITEENGGEAVGGGRWNIPSS